MKKLAWLCLLVFMISLIPILFCSFYDYSTGDDLGFSAPVHQLMLNGASFWTILKTMGGMVKDYWYGYQGTWSSLILFQLQPGIWGERVYCITPWLSLAFFLGGNGLLLYYLLVRHLGLQRSGLWCIFSLLSIASIQYIPKIRGGIFWYTSVAHYIIPYGIALTCAALAIKWLDTGRKGYFVFCCILMSYLGGAGYPPLVLAFVLFVLLIAEYSFRICGIADTEVMLSAKGDGHFLGGNKSTKPTSADRIEARHGEQETMLRVRALLLPLALLTIGFAISAAAPGNKNRGGSDFGFSVSRAGQVIVHSICDNLTQGIGYFMTARLLLVIVPAVFLIAYEAYTGTRGYRVKHPILFVVLAFLTSCAVRTPRLYANVYVSGGVPDTEYFTFVLCLLLTVSYVAVWLRGWKEQRKEKTSTNRFNEGRFNRRFRTPYLVAAALFCILMARHLISGTADQTCFDFIRSGQLQDFNNQMQERLAILEDPAIRNAVVPEMNDEQGPFMHMTLGPDPDALINRETAAYYGKESVIAVPREEYYKEFNNSVRETD